MHTTDVGLCSYAYRYAIGTAAFRPAKPMTPFRLIDEAERLGFGRVVFYDNIGTHAFAAALCRDLAGALAAKGMTAAFGLRHLEEDTFSRHLPLARDIGADCLRITIPVTGSFDGAVTWARKVLAGNLRRIEDAGIVIGVENHFSLPPEHLARLVESLDHPLIQYIYDATNSICFIEKPAETLDRMHARIHTAHIKDYVFDKLEAGYLMRGTILGEGVLDPRTLLEAVLRRNPGAKVELELSLPRPEGLSPEEVIAWEAACVEKSAKALFAAMER